MTFSGFVQKASRYTAIVAGMVACDCALRGVLHTDTLTVFSAAGTQRTALNNTFELGTDGPRRVAARRHAIVSALAHEKGKTTIVYVKSGIVTSGNEVTVYAFPEAAKRPTVFANVIDNAEMPGNGTFTLEQRVGIYASELEEALAAATSVGGAPIGA